MSRNLPLGNLYGMASEARREKLTEELSRVNLQIRPDSKLCRGFINGDLGPEWSLQRVVHESALMHWLYNCTAYRSCLNEASKQWAPLFVCGADFRTFFRLVLVPGVKLHIINTHGGVPDVWPWLQWPRSSH